MSTQPAANPTASSNVTLSDIIWRVLPGCRAAVGKLKKIMGEDGYQESKEALQDTLCDYFNGGNCDYKGLQISPMGGTKAGGKCFKVRWSLPGGGKSGGLRIAVVAYCAAKSVTIAKMWVRKDEPSDGEFDAAVETA